MKFFLLIFHVILYLILLAPFLGTPPWHNTAFVYIFVNFVFFKFFAAMPCHLLPPTHLKYFININLQVILWHAQHLFNTGMSILSSHSPTFSRWTRCFKLVYFTISLCSPSIPSPILDTKPLQCVLSWFITHITP